MKELQLVIEKAAFKQTLRILKPALTKKQVGEACLSFKENKLTFEVPGASVSADAEGHWPGIARFPISWLQRFSTLLKGKGSVTMAFKDGRLSVDSFSFAAKWQDISAPRISLPMDPTLLDVVLLRYLYSKAEIISSGLMPLLEEKEKVARIYFNTAAGRLEEIGIKKQALTDWVDKQLREIAKQRKG